MNKNIFHITFFLCLFLPIIYGYEFSFDALRSSIQDIYEKQSLNIVYEKAQTYHDYIRQKVDDINLNELQKTGGKRLPTLCSNDDYYYYIIRYIPSTLKSYVLAENADEQPFQQRYTSKERHQQFYQTIKTLPPTIHDKAVTAKAELEHYISHVPFSGIHSINSDSSSTWNDYIDEMKGHLENIKTDMGSTFKDHQQKLKEYTDQGMVVMELFDAASNGSKHIIYHDIYEQWANDKQRLEDILKQRQRSYKQWQSKVEMGFLDTATTMGPLRQLAEDMYDDAMNGTLTILAGLLKNDENQLDDWSSTSLISLRQLEDIILSLPTTTTFDQLDDAKKNTNSILDYLGTKLDQMKSSGGSGKSVRAIDSIWYNAKNELIYSRWQWKYWLDLWNQEGAYSIVRFFTTSPQ